MERAKAIYDYALDLEPEEREEFLQQISSEDPELLKQVRVMLARADADTEEIASRVEATAPAPAQSYIFAPGDMIGGRYRVLCAIARGGMGEVYEVADLELHGRVALKVISLKSAAKPNSAEMFRREITLARQVTHPNVCRIYDIGHHDHSQHGDLLFLTMEFLEGRTLADRIRTQGTLSKDEALPLLRQMIDALAAAHRLNIAHRDFKSANVILCNPQPVSDSGRVASATPVGSSGTSSEPDCGGEKPGAPASLGGTSAAGGDSAARATKSLLVKVTDFGLARSVDGLETTLHGEIWGTPDYMAPEQFRGHSSVASDIYALGVVIYEMFTAKLPHRSSTSPQTPDGKPGAAMEKIPAEWRHVVKKCMAYEAADRYATVEDVWRSLNGEKAGTSKTGIFGISNKALAGIAAVLLIALGLTGWLNREVVRRWLNPVPEQKHIAVLPFHNVGDDPANQAFCDGVAYSLSSKLSQFEQFHPDLWVIPADDARAVGNGNEALRRLNADLVLTGSVERMSKGAVVTINLVDTRKHKQLASRVVSASMGTLDTLQDSAWQSAANMLDLQVTPAATAQLAKQDTKQPGAYDFYLQGLGYLERVHSDSPELDNAVQMFSKASDKDSTYVLAYSGLARAYALKYYYTKDAQWSDKAAWNGRHAVAIDGNLAVSRYSLGIIYQQTGQLDLALTEYRKALEIDPKMIEASLRIAEIFVSRAQFSEAEQQCRTAIAERPGYSKSYIHLGNVYYQQGNFEAARAQFQTAIAITPDNPVGYQDLALVYMAAHNYEQAVDVLRSELKLKQTPALWSNLGAALMYMGRYPEAVDAMEHAAQLAPHDHMILRNLGDSYRQVPSQKSKADGAYKRALLAAQDELKIDPNRKEALAGIGLYEAHLGNVKAAEKDAFRAVAVYPKDNWVWFTSALVYETIGNRNQALIAIDKSWKAGFPLAEIEQEPELTSLRADSRYKTWSKQATQSNPSS
jgi:serine/threonine protein kinase/tetratricopeptide (TPR) repeat protein